jgi:hypothetical protein
MIIIVQLLAEMAIEKEVKAVMMEERLPEMDVLQIALWNLDGVVTQQLQMYALKIVLPVALGRNVV